MGEGREGDRVFACWKCGKGVLASDPHFVKGVVVYCSRACVGLPPEATGPQTERSGVPDEDDVYLQALCSDPNVVTVELTREEAENLEMSVTYGLSHTPSNPPDRRDLYCPTCRALASLRASLERTSK